MDDQGRPQGAASPSATSGLATQDAPVGIKGTDSAGREVTDLPAVSVVADGSAEDTCDVCRTTGLAILPTRYAVVPDNCAALGLGPVESGRACSEDVEAAGYKYALRTLRQGFLYLFYESGPQGANYWEAYAIARNGTLWRQPSAAMAKGIVGGGLPSCRRDGHDATRMEFIVVSRPQQCGTVWLAYSQDRWTPATLDRYAGSKPAREERMQPIEPAAWVTTPQSGGYVAPIAEASDLKVAMEYDTFPEVVGDHPELPYFSRPEQISREDGGYVERELRRNATRTPWSLRNQQLGGDPEPDVSLETTFGALKGASGARGGAGAPAPMMVALWDPIGVVHELNGYRHDVLGHIARYYEERRLQVGAIDQFQQIEVLLQQHASVMGGQHAQASRSEARRRAEEGDGWVSSRLRGREHAIMDEHRALMDRYRSGEIDWETYRSGRSAAIRRHAEFDSSGRRPGEIEGAFGMHDVVRRMDSPESEAILTDVFSEMNRRRATDDWNDKYRPLVDEGAIETYERNVQAFLDAATGLLEQRSEALGKWLQNELFLAVLEDYDGAEPVCGVTFERAVTDAVDALAVDKVGRGILETLSDNLSVTERSCLLWRVVAQNQDDAREELEQVLAEADSLKDRALDAAGAGWNAFVGAAGRLKKFLGYYKKFEDVEKEAIATSPSNAMLKATGVDRFVVATGAILLERFPLKQIDDRVGNALVRHALGVRAGMDAVESSNLISAQAAHEPQLKRYFADRLRHHRSRVGTRNGALMLALQDLNRQGGRQVLARQWQQVASASSNPVRLAGLTGALEIVNFASILARADKDAKDYGMLVASGLSMASVYASVATAVNKELFTDTSKSFANVKAVGSALGGFATMIGGVFDWISADQARQENRYGLMVSYGVKAFLGTGVAGAQLLTGLAYSAPVLQRAIGRGSAIVWLDNVRNGISGAAAVRSAQATGEALKAGAIRQGALMGLGRWVLYLAGWQVAVGVTAVQGLIWVLSPNDLEDWCERNYFGKVRKKNFLGFGGSGSKYATVEEQEDAFQKAIANVGIAPPEGEAVAP